MDFLGSTAAVGGLLLLMSLAFGWINRGLLTVFCLYLIAGIICGPWMLGLLHFNLTQHAILVARTTEIAMVTSLFISKRRWNYTCSLRSLSCHAFAPDHDEELMHKNQPYTQWNSIIWRA